MGREEMYHKNEGLAIAAAHKYFKMNMELMNKKLIDLQDCIQIAKEALWRCTRTYNDKKGTKFSTYATKSILYVLNKRTKDEFNRVWIPRRDTWDIPNHQGNELELKALYSGSYSYLNEQVNDGTGEYTELLDLIGKEDVNYKIVEIEDIINRMDNDEKILIQNLIEDKTQYEIAEILNISQPRVHRKISFLKKKFRKALIS